MSCVARLCAQTATVQQNDDVRRQYARASVFIYETRNEGMTNVKKSENQRNRAGAGSAPAGNRLEAGGSGKPQILIESSFGDSHPGSAHLLELSQEAKKGAAAEGGYGARYFCTDICDGRPRATTVSTTPWPPGI